MSHDDPRIAVLTTEDDALGQHLARKLKQRVLFNHATQSWHILDTKTGIWAPDKTADVIKMVFDIAREGLALVEEEMSEEEAKFARRPFAKLSQVQGCKSALEALSTYPEYKTAGTDWDSDENLLGCANGIVDLRTGKLIKVDPKNRVSKNTGIIYREEWTIAEAAEHTERFRKFLLEVTSGDEPLAEFYLRWFGYSLLGHARAQKFLIMSGKLGRNGKGVLKRLMLKVFGEYAAEVAPSLYAASKWGEVQSDRPRADLVHLFGLRLTFVPEPQGAFNTEMLKQHTGGDRISARTLNSRVILSWEAAHSIVFHTNKIPETSEVGHAIKDRVLVADFNEVWGDDRRDNNLDAKLQAEAEGVLWMLVQEAMKWPTEGLGAIPDRIINASKNYMEDNDPLSQFFAEACDIRQSQQVKPRVLYAGYMKWHARASDVDGEPLNEKMFGHYVQSQFQKQGKPATYRGLTLKELVEDDD